MLPSIRFKSAEPKFVSDCRSTVEDRMDELRLEVVVVYILGRAVSME